MGYGRDYKKNDLELKMKLTQEQIKQIDYYDKQIMAFEMSGDSRSIARIESIKERFIRNAREASDNYKRIEEQKARAEQDQLNKLYDLRYFSGLTNKNLFNDIFGPKGQALGYLEYSQKYTYKFTSEILRDVQSGDFKIDMFFKTWQMSAKNIPVKACYGNRLYRVDSDGSLVLISANDDSSG